MSMVLGYYVLSFLFVCLCLWYLVLCFEDLKNISVVVHIRLLVRACIWFLDIRFYNNCT